MGESGAWDNQCTEVFPSALIPLHFWGEDGFLSQSEEQVAITWLGMLAQRMWKSASQRTPRCAWFLSLALTYNDQDFQRLILNEEAKKKKKKKSRRSSGGATTEAMVIGAKVA